MFPQYILTKIKYILNNVYIIPLTKKQKFDQLFIVKNYWGGGGVTTPQAPPVATPLHIEVNIVTLPLKSLTSIVCFGYRLNRSYGKDYYLSIDLPVCYILLTIFYLTDDFLALVVWVRILDRQGNIVSVYVAYL